MCFRKRNHFRLNNSKKVRGHPTYIYKKVGDKYHFIGITHSEITHRTKNIKLDKNPNPDDPRDPRNGYVTGIKCIKMELGAPDESGRRSPVEVPGSEFVLDVDTVIMAIGTSPNPLIKNTTSGLEVNRRGGIIINEDGLTSRERVYAGGDAVTGAATVISAMGAGKLAAKSIDAFFSQK